MWIRIGTGKKNIALEKEVAQLKTDTSEACKIIDWLSNGEYKTINLGT